MRVGIYLDLRRAPTSTRSWPDHYARWLELVEEADHQGAGSVWLTEHHFFDDGYIPQPLTFAAAIAARTRHVRIGMAVLLLPLHQVIEVAEQAAVVDVVSGGRLELGLGVGYRRPEYEAFAGVYRTRYETFEARVHELRRLWGEEEGDVRVTPAPVQRPLPLWCGFSGARGARLAGRLGAGLLVLDGTHLDAYEKGLAEAGGIPSRPRLAGLVEALLADDPERAWTRARAAVAARWDSYHRYTFEGTGRDTPPPVDPEAWRASGRIVVGTPEDVAAVVRRRTEGLPVEDVHCWGDYPGAPDDVVEEHLRLLHSRLAPLLAAGPAGEPQGAALAGGAQP